jgi:mitochondrial fission protein ELM1
VALLFLPENEHALQVSKIDACRRVRRTYRMMENGLKNEDNLHADDMIQRATTPKPRVWLLTGYRAGDNAQVLALAEALNWPFEVKHFVYGKYEFITNRLLGRTLAGVDLARSDKLAPPWPDVVITAGRRNEPIARWIKAQAGGRTRLIHLGRSWAKPDHFDLIVTTPQYDVPAHPHVLQIEAPLHRVTASALRDAAERWRPSIAQLQSPLIAVLVGGDSPPYVFDARMAQRLGRETLALARARGGSVLVATSPRTSPAAVSALSDILAEARDVPSQAYRWIPDPGTNPYLGYLALADILVVTGDSMSMVAEACATGKPVQIFDMGDGWTRMKSGDDGWPSLPASMSLAERFRPRRVLHWMLAHWLPRRIRRDIRNILRPMVAQGRATWLGDDLQATSTPSPSTDLPRSVARVKALFNDQAGADQ